MTSQTVHIQELTRPTHWFCCRCWVVNPITAATCPTIHLPSNTLCTHRLAHCDTTRCLRLDPRSASLFTTLYTDWLTPDPRPLYTYTCHSAGHTSPLLQLLTGSNLCCGQATLLSQVKAPGWTVSPAIDSWTASLGDPDNVRRWQRWMYTCEEAIPTSRRYRDRLDDFWDGEERHPDWADDWIFWGDEIPGGPPDDPEGHGVLTPWSPVSDYAGRFAEPWDDVSKEDEDGESEDGDEESDEESDVGVDLSLPRCLPCLKLKDKEEKNGCDRQQPICRRCKDAGLPAEECIPEPKGNLRDGLYGRQPVKAAVEQTCLLPAAPAPTPTTENGEVFDSNTPFAPASFSPLATTPSPSPAASPPTTQPEPTPAPTEKKKKRKHHSRFRARFHNSYATRAIREANRQANARLRAQQAEIDALKERVKELEREAEELREQLGYVMGEE